MMRYYRRGVQLVNRAPVLYGIAVVLAVVALIPIANIVLGLVAFVYALFVLGYNVSIPAFLQDIQNAKRLSARSLWSVTRHNTARLALPLLLAVFILVVVLIVLVVLVVLVVVVVVVVTPSHSRSSRYSTVHWQYSYEARLIVSLVVAFAQSLFVFMPIFFSVEMRGFFRSILQSLQFARRHLDLVLSVVVIYVTMALVISVLPTTVAWISLLRSLLYQYASLVILATALLHYQDQRRREGPGDVADQPPPLSSHL